MQMSESSAAGNDFFRPAGTDIDVQQVVSSKGLKSKPRYEDDIN
jgi:hypothetical protein